MQGNVRLTLNFSYTNACCSTYRRSNGITAIFEDVIQPVGAVYVIKSSPQLPHTYRISKIVDLLFLFRGVSIIREGSCEFHFGS
jgi:hypothetical protein